MSRGAPAGWYADPGEPGQLRWWDGAAWAPDTVAPAGAAGAEGDARDEVIDEEVGESAPGESAAAPDEDDVAEPVAGGSPDRESADSATRNEMTPDAASPAAMPPAVTAPAAAPPAAPSPAAASPAAAAPAQHPTPTADAPARQPSPGTVWVWLSIVFSILPFCSALVIDAVTVSRVIGVLLLPDGFDPGPGGWVVAGLLLLTWVNGLFLAASVLFAWLDVRALRRRGIERPFAWGWSLLVFVATLGVYVVGRTIVVRRRTGRGTAPLWGWMILLIVGLSALALWLAVFVDTLWAMVATVS
ncbi:DUF2510 domain-containing protein [Microbacterium sp.]|uniref:DUF2510 domain-containing protein n=1 Tax=Microbacterium sp. TaxID=51671 RepID=UPI003734DFD6